MYGLARLKQIEEEKKARKLEREQKKKEKEKEKKRLKSLAKKKKAQQRHNKKYYAKVRKKRLEEKAKIGDENAWFTILLTKNRKRIERLGLVKWKTDAYKIFNDAIQKNRQEVKFPIKFVSTDTSDTISMKYEILIIKKIKEGEENIIKMRNENGKLVDNVIIDKTQHVIVDKCEWFVEETFHVYGYHPIRNRKTYDFILNEILLKDINDKFDIRTIFTYYNKVFIKYIDDFDFIVCKNADEAKRLAKQLEKDIPKLLKKNILYIGEINKNLTSQLVQDMIKKTGWPRNLCTKTFL